MRKKHTDTTAKVLHRCHRRTFLCKTNVVNENTNKPLVKTEIDY